MHLWRRAGELLAGFLLLARQGCSSPPPRSPSPLISAAALLATHEYDPLGEVVHDLSCAASRVLAATHSRM